MSRFGNFFLSRAIANAFGFKGLERDVFFAMNYLNSQSSYSRNRKRKVEVKKDPDLIIHCTEKTFPKSIGYAFDYLTKRENLDKTARIEVYKRIKIERD